MQIGERLKRIREFRGMTQKELGLAIGFSDSTARVRIGQYENGQRMSKKDTADAIAKVLNCNPINFYDSADLGYGELTMMDMFWLEERVSGGMYVIQLERYNDKNDTTIVKGLCNSAKYDGIFPPVAIAMNYPLVNDFMREWAIRFQELQNREITREEYFEWKINWPASCDDGGRFEPSYKWRKIHDKTV